MGQGQRMTGERSSHGMSEKEVDEYLKRWLNKPSSVPEPRRINDEPHGLEVPQGGLGPNLDYLEFGDPLHHRVPYGPERESSLERETRGSQDPDAAVLELWANQPSSVPEPRRINETHGLEVPSDFDNRTYEGSHLDPDLAKKLSKFGLP